MLVAIQIKNLALIRESEIKLGSGLNVITGETGAGKSMLVAALELALGGKATAGWVRNGCEAAEIEAHFRQAPSASATDSAKTSGVAPKTVLRRVIAPSGRARNYINGKAVSRSELRKAAMELAEVCSQHEHHRLADEAAQLVYLDNFAGAMLLRQRFEKLFEQGRSARAQLDQVLLQKHNRERRETELDEAIAELSAAHLQLGEDTELDALRVRLQHRTELQRLLSFAEQRLDDADDSVLEQLTAIGRAMREAAQIDETLGRVLEVLLACQTEVEGACRSLRRYEVADASNGLSLDQIEERLHELNRLKRRYGGSIKAALATLETLQLERQGLEVLDGTESELRSQLQGLDDELLKAAEELSRARRAAGRRLGTQIEAELRGLGMPHAQAQLALRPVEEAEGTLLLADKLRVAYCGAERLQMLLSANQGQALRPLAGVASGGELSRVLLAVQCCLAQSNAPGLLVFDEVDSGVGGAIAEVIGRKIHAVSKCSQVLCVTHLAAIAAFADRHFLVQKSAQAGSTESVTTCLGASAQAEEVARMLGGVRITRTVRAAAREMLRNARQRAA